MTDEVEELLRVLGPFYELVEEKKKITQISDLSTGRFLLNKWNLSIFHFVSDVKFSMWSVTFYNLPLVICSARLTQFARQLEGKYITVKIQ